MFVHSWVWTEGAHKHSLLLPAPLTILKQGHNELCSSPRKTLAYRLKRNDREKDHVPENKAKRNPMLPRKLAILR